MLALIPTILGIIGSLLSLFKIGGGSVNTVTGASVVQTQDVIAAESAMLQAASDTPNRVAAVAELEKGHA